MVSPVLRRPEPLYVVDPDPQNVPPISNRLTREFSRVASELMSLLAMGRGRRNVLLRLAMFSLIMLVGRFKMMVLSSSVMRSSSQVTFDGRVRCDYCG
jgi:hypothetical protein